MAAPPPGFRCIDIPTHLHLDWPWGAIRCWFVGRAGSNVLSGTDPAYVAEFRDARGVE